MTGFGHTGVRVPLPKPAPSPPPAPAPVRVPAIPVGLVLHTITPPRIDTLRALGVTQVRWTLYWSRWNDPAYQADARAQISRALDAGLELLICAHGVPPECQGQTDDAILLGFAAWLAERVQEWPGVAWQPWNEPDVQTFTTLFTGRMRTPYDAGVRYGAHVVDLARLLPAGTRLVTAGIASDPYTVGTAFLNGMLKGLTPIRGTSAFPTVAVHAYGPPPATKIAQWINVLRSAREWCGVDFAAWCTEFGISGDDMARAWAVPADQWEQRQAVEWSATVQVAELTVPSLARCYGYVLDATSGEDYGIERPDGSLRPAGEWIALRQGGRRAA